MAYLSPNHHNARFYWLDWARFLAAFWVLVVHARGYSWVAYGDLQRESQGLLAAGFFAITRIGHEAVIFFFVLSGFLVGGKLLERCLNGSFDIKSYCIDRVSRIYVPLIPIIIFSILLGLIRNRYSEPAVVAGNLFGLQGVFVDTVVGNAPLWSLAYEMWFYVMAGALAVVLAGKRHRVLAFLLVLISLLIFIKLDPVLLMVWWLAACGYFLRDSKALFWPGLIMAMVGGVCMQLTSVSETVNIRMQFMAYFPDDLFVLIFGTGLTLFVASICNRKPSSQTAQQFEFLGSKLAAFSYTLYLIHYPILALWSHSWPGKYAVMDFNSLGIFFARIIVCLLVAIIFFVLFESHTLSVRRWLNARWQVSIPVPAKA